MPSWNIHLEAGEHLASKLKLRADKKREFLLGCILPDINNGYINHAHIVKSHNMTHYAREQKSSLNFYAENKRQVDTKNPIYLGYIFHLFTDGFFNYDFFHRINHDPRFSNLDQPSKLKIKHHDFWVYDVKLHHELGIKKDELTYFINIANQINPVVINEKELAEVLQILIDDNLDDAYENEDYQFYTEADLEDLLNRTVEAFSEQYLGERYA